MTQKKIVECSGYAVAFGNAKKQPPKTADVVRVVDVPEQLAKVLREYLVGRFGLLFATRDRKPLSNRSVRRRFCTVGATCGFYAFRWLRDWAQRTGLDFAAGGLLGLQTLFKLRGCELCNANKTLIKMARPRGRY